MKRKLFYFQLIIYLITSCETIKEFDLPEIQPKLVINCLFNPDSLFKVNITSSKPKDSKDFYLSYRYEFIEDARIILFQDDTSIFDFIYKGKGNYIEVFKMMISIQNNRLECLKD